MQGGCVTPLMALVQQLVGQSGDQLRILQGQSTKESWREKERNTGRKRKKERERNTERKKGRKRENECVFRDRNTMTR